MSNYLTVSKNFSTGYKNVNQNYREEQGLQSQKFASMCPAYVLYPLCNANVNYGPSCNVNSFCTQNIQSPETPYFSEYGPCPIFLEKKTSNVVSDNLFVKTNWDNPCPCCLQKFKIIKENFTNQKTSELGSSQSSTSVGPGCKAAMGGTDVLACNQNECSTGTAWSGRTDLCANSCACNCTCTMTNNAGPENNNLQGSGGTCGDNQWMLGWGGEGGGNQCQQSFNCGDQTRMYGAANFPIANTDQIGLNSWVSTTDVTSGYSSIEQNHGEQILRLSPNKHGIIEAN